MLILSAQSVSASVSAAPLLSQIDLDIKAGELVAIIGANGSGKTSLVKALTGDLGLSAGRVLLNQKPLGEYSPEAKARAVAILPQQSILSFPFTAEEVAALGRMPHASGAAIDRDIVRQVLAEMDISYLAKRYYTQLSGGEKQRVQLARVMAQVWRAEDSDFRLLVLDEPTSALDVGHQQQLMKAARRLVDNGAAVLMILHDFNLAARYADRIVAMSCGSIALQGRPDAVVTSANMKHLFGIDASVIAHPVSGHPVVLIND